MRTEQMTVRQRVPVRHVPRRLRMPRWVWVALVVLFLPAVLHTADLIMTQRRVGQLRYVVRQAQLAPPPSITGSGSAQRNRQVHAFTLSLLSSLSNTQYSLAPTLQSERAGLAIRGIDARAATVDAHACHRSAKATIGFCKIRRC